jgi:hypothetical protein
MTATFRSDFISLLHAISVRTSEHLSLSRQCGFASPAQLLSFLAVNQTQIVTSITTSGYQAAPILRRCLTRGLPECTGEIGLTRRPERECDIGQGPIRIREQLLGALQTLCADMPMLNTDPAPSCVHRVAGRRQCLSCLHARRSARSTPNQRGPLGRRNSRARA